MIGKWTGLIYLMKSEITHETITRKRKSLRVERVAHIWGHECAQIFLFVVQYFQ